MKLEKSILKIDCGKTSKETEDFIKKQLVEFNRDGVILGLSGGIDSAVAAALAVRAVGKEKILVLILPERDSDPQNIKDAREYAKALGIEVIERNITPIIRKFGAYKIVPSAIFFPRKFKEKFVRKIHESFVEKGKRPFLESMLGTKEDMLEKGAAFYRIKVRARMLMLYFYAEQRNLLVLGTCNKTEKLIGFFAKHGDSAADIVLLAHLYKTQVRELARYLDVPQKIIDKAPSPDLLPGITDEYAIGMPYETVDLILYGLSNNMSKEEIAKELGIEADKVDYVIELNKKSKHMRELPRELPVSLGG